MRKIYLLLLTVLFAVVTNAQVTGTKTIGVDYPTIAAAVTALNTTGVGAGGATINVPAGYTETVPSGGLVLGSTLLNASLSAVNTLTIKKTTAAGTNPLLTAFTGGTSLVSDGIFKIQGADWVTIDGIDVKENAANTGAAFMEWGYALVNLNAAAPFDGVQNTTIKNCSVTLDRNNPNGAFGIYSAHNIATNATALTLTAVGDLHSNNKFYTNTISNVNEGFWLLGFAAVTPFTLYDQNNEVGGSSAALGNTVKTMGVTALFNTFCIYLVNQNNAKASYNIIDNAAGGGVTSSTQLIGIYSAGTNSVVTENNNNILLTTAAGTAITAGIYNASTGDLTATANTIAFSDASGSGTHYGILSTSGTTANITNNTLSANTTGTITGALYFIYINSAAATVNVTGNTISNTNISTNNTTAGIYNASFVIGNYTVSNNTITNINRTASAGTHYNIYTGSPTIGTFNANTIDNITFSAPGSTGTIYGIYDISSGVTMTYTNNIVRNFSTPSTGTLYGIREFGVTGVKTIQNNQVYNFSTSLGGAGGTSMTGITLLVGTTDDVSNNQVYSLNSTGTTGGTGGAIIGLLVSGGTTNNIYKNKIYDISSNSTGGTVWGMQVTAGTTNNMYNNLIGDIRAPFANSTTDLVRGINLSSTTTVSAINLYYNTIYLNASSNGANFATSGVFHAASATATTANLTMRNNIIYNNSFANGTGLVTAFRRSVGTAGTLANYNAASNNNLFFAGATGPSQLIYYDGTSAAQTLAAYQAGVFTAGTIAPRDNLSVTELSTPFLSTTGSSPTFLHISAVIPTVAESGGLPIATYTDDYDGNTRNAATPDIGADEFSGLPVTACAGTPVAGTISGNNNICAGQSSVLTLSGFSSNTGISIQWKSATVSGGPYSPIAGATGSSYNTGVIPTGTTVYYVATVTCSNGGGNATTTQYAVTSNASPTIAVNPPAPSICSGGAGVSLTASGALTYSWFPTTGLSSGTGATVTANPASTTTYTVTGTNAAGCTGSTNVTVTVNSAPVVTTSATPAVVCAGANSQLNSTVSLGAPANAYSLSSLTGQTYAPLTGAGITIINTNAQLTATMGGATQDDGGVVVTLPFTFTYLGNTFTQMSMCTNGWVGAGDQGTIDAVSMRAPGNFFTSVIPNNTIAAWFKDMGANFPLGTGSMRHGLIGTGVYAFQWDNAIGSGFTDGSTITISFQVNLYGPTSSAPGRIDIIYGPAVGATTFGAAIGIEDAIGGTNHYINALDGTGTSTTTSSVWPGNGNGYRFTPLTATYLWSPSTFLSSTTISNPVATAITNTTTYTLTATSGNGCSATSNVTVTVLSPTVTGTVVQPTTCVSTNGSITLAVSGGTGGVGPYTYAWTGTGVVPASQNQTNLPVGSYSVVVTDVPSGCTRTVVFDLPGPGGCNICPTIPTLTSNPTPGACPNSNVVFTTTGMTNMGVTYGVTFKYSSTALADPYTGGTTIATVANGALTNGNTQASTTTVFATPGTYFVYAILSPSPTNPACRPFAQTSITINPTPTVNAVGNQVLCNGSSTTAVTFSGTPAGVVFNWTNSAPSIGIPATGTGNIASFVAANAGNTPVVATIVVTPSYTNLGATCTGTSISFTITVNPTPTVNIVTNQVVCNNASTAAVVFGSPVTGTTFSWTNNTTSIGLGASGSGNIASFVATNATTAPVTATITVTPSYTNAGVTCTGPQRTFTITVNPTPTVAAVANQTVCAGAATTAVTFTGAVAGTVFNWTNNTASIGLAATGSGNIASFIAVNAGTTPVVATITVTPSYTNAATTCTGTPTTFTITVNPRPTVTCPPNMVVNAVAGTCAAPVTYPAATATGVPAPTITYSAASGSSFPVGVTTVNVTATNTCGVATCSFTITVTDVQVPAITTQPANRTVCVGANATFSVTATNVASYQWQAFNGTAFVNIAGATTANYTVNSVTLPMNTNSFRVVLTGLCSATTTSAIATLFVNPLPTISLSASPTPVLLPQQTTTITATTSPSGGTFVWFRNGVVVPGATGAVLAGIGVDQLGTYKAVYTDPNGCVSTSADLVVSGAVFSNIFVYPNPNNGTFSVRFYNPSTGNYTVSVFNSQGGLVYRRKADSSGLLTVTLGAATSDGVYLVELRDSSNKLIGAKRIMVQRN